MMRFIIFNFLFILMASKCLAKDLPSYFPRCYIDDPNLNNCLLKAAKELQPHIRKGIPEIKLPSFDPLVTEYGMSQTDHPIINYTLYLWNFTIQNVGNYEFKEIRFDPVDFTIRGRILFPPTPTTSMCEVTGDYLTIHSYGKGVVFGQYENADLQFVITGEKVARKGKEYYNPKAVKIHLLIDDFKVNVTDIFENREIGTLATGLLHASSKLIIDNLAPVYAQVIEAMWLRYLKYLTKKIPLDKLLPRST